MTPLLFGDLLFTQNVLLQVIIATLVFCAVSGFIYILNDIKDRACDVYHPIKKDRPLVSGAVSIIQAWIIAMILLLIAIIGLIMMPPLFTGVICLYVVQSVLYTLWMKNIVIVDVIIIGIGFVLRVLAGCIAADVILSPWLFTAAFLLALLLGFSKRSFEKGLILDATEHRSVLGNYHNFVLQAYLIISATAVLMVYIIYAITGSHTEYFVLTIPFVIFGVFSFLSKSLVSGLDPDALLKDSGFLANLIIWLVVVVFLLYGL